MNPEDRPSRRNAFFGMIVSSINTRSNESFANSNEDVHCPTGLHSPLAAEHRRYAISCRSELTILNGPPANHMPRRATST
jgi:hypothetical protein